MNDVLDLIDDTQGKIRGFTEAVNRGEVGFVVVGIPTRLSLEESKRVVGDINKLGDRGNIVSHVVVNQVLPESLGEDDAKREDFTSRRAKSHAVKISELKASISQHVSNIHTIPYIDTEIVGVPGLSYLGDTHFDTPELESSIFAPPASSELSKVLVYGGKGGVGKTTTSSASAVRLAKLGHKVAIVSTDPAHSLGDALGVQLNGGEGVDLTPLMYDNPGNGELKAFEIDPDKEVGEFKDMLKSLSTPKAVENEGVNIGDLAGVLDTLPPGADEVIALGKVLDLLKVGGYTRIVLDTAPTGHTVKMLTFPRYIDGVIEKVLKIADRVTPTAIMVNGNLKEEDIEEAKSKLLGFQLKMFELDEMFTDPDKCGFCVVTIPTDLAVKETVRLVEELKDGKVKVKVSNVFINQVAGTEGEGFVGNVLKGQKRIIGEFEKEFDNVVKVEMMDEEPKGVYGLMSLFGFYQ